MGSISPSSSASNARMAVAMPEFPFNGLINPARLTSEQIMEALRMYYQSVSTVCGVRESSMGSGLSSEVTSVSSQVSRRSSNWSKRQRRKRKARSASVASGLSGSADVSEVQGEAVHGEVVDVDQQGNCYLGMIVASQRAEAGRLLGKAPSLLSILDSPVGWFDFSKFDDLNLKLFGSSCHLSSGEGLPLRGVLSALARGCHAVSGTLAAAAVRWEECSAEGFLYDTLVGGLASAAESQVSAVVGVEDRSEVPEYTIRDILAYLRLREQYALRFPPGSGRLGSALTVVGRPRMAVPEGCVLLGSSQADVARLRREYAADGLEVCTVHEFAGRSAEHVWLFKFDESPCWDDSAWAARVLSFHTRRLVYVRNSVRMDVVADWVSALVRDHCQVNFGYRVGELLDNRIDAEVLRADLSRSGYYQAVYSG